ncbi:hypothetical protein CIL05_05595 [Virgibacillus profundi]|uniref:Uncharacterized protein n=1 Tax=Virgibacillus profundi TaxID=2024555 RepID=A0A2A2IHI1_9BACI|nr:hypothetical protein [Virgibacillus profundi]PAV30575.1 hypothetical protein CIL05_05595 [Virgibacillus profundi]PXY54747.1 hypothetical protein CIT14_05680 [Virgibacillus profundi]
MNYIDVIDEHKTRKEEPYWWITYFSILTVGLLIGISFIFGPFILLITFKSFWLLIPFLLVPLGFVIVKGIFKTFKKLIWKNNNLSEFTLKEDSISFEQWKKENPYKKQSEEFSVSSIDYVVFSYYTVRQTKNTRFNTITETAPMLYIIYTDTKKKLLSIPFYIKDSGINTWLSYFQEKGTPLKFTSIGLYNKYEDVLTDESRLDFLESGKTNLIAFTFENDWREQSTKLSREWEKTINEKHEIENEEINNQKPKTKERIPFKQWLVIALIVYGLMAIGIYTSVNLAEQGIIDEGGPLPGFTLLIILGFLYFYLFKYYLRWYHMIRFCVESFIICLIYAIVVEDRGKIAEEMGTSILGTAMLLIALIWIPYLIVKFIRKLGSSPKF